MVGRMYFTGAWGCS